LPACSVLRKRIGDEERRRILRQKKEKAENFSPLYMDIFGSKFETNPEL